MEQTDLDVGLRIAAMYIVTCARGKEEETRGKNRFAFKVARCCDLLA